MLQMLSVDVVDMCCWVLQTLFFQCCRRCVSMLHTCGVGCCVEEKGEEAPNVGCCTQHGSQHDRNIVATWGRREERLLTWMLQATAFATFS
jgi:hypothetical protein